MFSLIKKINFISSRCDNEVCRFLSTSLSLGQKQGLNLVKIFI